ncbi:hypothetical protein JS533_009040 [Bifidobacterium amazonense]|uniref:DNA-binding protein n=1 Tax=Bifidobacterium amazonense TaxID=2809027 RepID=A0ABS9VWQ9_9BIFI|nr:hypothetical protein [Bifidobacterium amazonense]MCH9276409.1 hypothetical protein [Bifidobacterium amazonense]
MTQTHHTAIDRTVPAVTIPDELTTQTARFVALMDRFAASPNPDDVRMTVEETSVYVPMSVGQLGQLRYIGRGPKFIKPSPKTVLYRKGDVDDWLASCVQNTTASSDEEAEQRAERISQYNEAAKAKYKKVNA